MNKPTRNFCRLWSSNVFSPSATNFFSSSATRVDYHFTSVPKTSGSTTEINNRFDEAIDMTLAWQMTQHWTFQPYYRFQYSNYRYNTLQTSDRNDYLNSLGFSLVYTINKNISLRTFFNYNIKNRTIPSLPPITNITAASAERWTSLSEIF